MNDRVRARFWIESGLAALSGLLLVLAVVNERWIEQWFEVEPDGGSGELEWLLVAVFGLLFAGSTLSAAREWRRRPAPAA